jgi:hypothetical protein
MIKNGYNTNMARTGVYLPYFRIYSSGAELSSMLLSNFA